MTTRKPSLIGQRFGKLVILSETTRPYYYLCKCDCGAETVKYSVHLLSGAYNACRKCSLSAFRRGKARIHGACFRHHTTRAYTAWKNMRQRCQNPNKPKYHNHGGRGIKVAPEWENFATFLADMGEPPPGLSIERRNNELGYSKDNCYWATNREQSRNRRNNLNFTVRGVSGCLKDLCERFQCNYSRTKRRVHRGWPIEQAIFVSKYSGGHPAKG